MSVTIPGSGQIIVQVKTAFDHNLYAFTGGWTDINNLAVTITPTSTSSKFICILQFGAIQTFDSRERTTGINILRCVSGSSCVEVDSNPATSGNHDGIGLRVGGYNTDGNHLYGHTLIQEDTPSTTSSITYKPSVNPEGTSSTCYINRSASNSNVTDMYGAYTVSSFMVMEVTS